VQIKAGICDAQLGDTPGALLKFQVLLNESTAEYPDLFMEVGDFLVELNEDKQVCYHCGHLAGLLSRQPGTLLISSGLQPP